MTNRIDRIDHVGIVCRDLDEAIQFYRSVYGFELCHVEVIESQGVREAVMRIGDPADEGAPYVQLLEPVRPDSAVSAWLDRRGPGLHHVAFGTGDVGAAADDLRGQGIPPIIDPPGIGPRGARVTFLHPRDCLGVLTELVEPPSFGAPAAGADPSAR